MSSSSARIVAIPAGLVDCETGQVRGAREARLTRNERLLFVYLTARPGVVVSKEQLLTEVWGYAPGSESRTVYSTVQRLRTKIEADPDTPRHLLTVGRRGYMFTPMAPAAQTPAPVGAVGFRPFDTFLGRQELGSRLRAWVLDPESSRALGLVGLPGIGKTRLAQEFAHEHHLERPAGTCFVDGDHATDHDALLAAIARQLRLPAQVDARLPARIARVLTASGRGLLVLDGIDQMTGLSELVEAVSHRDLRLLVISREPVMQPSLVVGPLGIGEDGDAVKLFVERSRSRWPRWHPSPLDLEAIGRIVTLLDGSPLGIELAAHAIQVMAPAELADRLLAGDALDGLDRGIRWAWEGLGLDDRRCLAAMAVFPSDFDLAGAQAVCGEDRMLDVLSRLADRALLVAREVPAGRRFLLPGTVHTYAQKHLEGDPSALNEARSRHARHYGELGGDEAVEWIVRHGTARHYQRLREEQPNLRAARGYDAGLDGAFAARAAVVVWMFDGLIRPARRLMESVLEASELPAHLTIWLRRTAAEARRRLGDIAGARSMLDEALDLARTQAPERVGEVLHALGVLEEVNGSPSAAERHLVDALEEHERNGDAFRRGLSLGELASLRLRRGRLAESVPLFKDALEVLRAVQAPQMEVIYLGNLAVSEMKLGRFRAAESSLLEAIAGSRRLEAHRFEVGNLSNLGLLYASTGDLDQAESTYREALDMMREVGDEFELCPTLSNLGMVLIRQGNLGEARSVLDQAAAGLVEQARPFVLGSTCLIRAHLCRLEGDRDRAMRRVAEAALWIARADLSELVPWLHAERGLLAAEADNRESAETHLELARTSLELCGVGAGDAHRAVNALAALFEANEGSEAGQTP